MCTTTRGRSLSFVKVRFPSRLFAPIFNTSKFVAASWHWRWTNLFWIQWNPKNNFIEILRYVPSPYSLGRRGPTLAHGLKCVGTLSEGGSFHQHNFLSSYTLIIIILWQVHWTRRRSHELEMFYLEAPVTILIVILIVRFCGKVKQDCRSGAGFPLPGAWQQIAQPQGVKQTQLPEKKSTQCI